MHGVLEWSWAAVLSGFLKWNPGGNVWSGINLYVFRIQKNFQIWVLILIITIPCPNRLSKLRIYQNIHV